MNPEILVSLIAIVSSGALTALINVFLEHKTQRREDHEKSVDDRIAAWQKISEKNDDQIKQLEKKLDSYSKDLKSLDRYILVLEQTILKIDASITLPERPILLTENNVNN